MLRAARARFALTLARAKIYSNTGALPQPPSGEPRSPEPLCAARYVRAISVFTKNYFHRKVFSFSPLTQYILVPLCSAHYTLRENPPLQRHASATPRHFPPPATSTAPITATLRPPPALPARQFPSLFALLLCLFRYPPSSDRRCVQFSSLFIVKLRRAVRSFPSADPASPFARLCDYRLSPI